MSLCIMRFIFDGKKTILIPSGTGITWGNIIYRFVTKKQVTDFLFEIMNRQHSSSMIETDAFWLETLHDYKIDRLLPLPYDRQRLSLKDQTNHVWSTTFNFDSNLSSIFRDWVSIMNTTPDHLAFTCYYIFLFKLTNGERDLCVGRNMWA